MTTSKRLLDFLAAFDRVFGLLPWIGRYAGNGEPPPEMFPGHANECENWIKENYPLVIALVVFWLSSPVLAIIPICLFFAVFNPSKGWKFVCLVFISLSLGLVNYTRISVSDLSGYYQWFGELNELSVYRFTELKQLDPLFYFTTSILAHLSNGFPPVFSLFWTTVIYFFLFWAIDELGNHFRIGSYWIAGIVLFAAFSAYGFTLSSHAVRQYVAMSLLVFGLSRILAEKKLGITFTFLAALCHSSALLFLPMVLALTSIHRIPLGKTVILFVACLLLACVAGTANLFEFGHLLTSSPFDSFNRELAYRLPLYIAGTEPKGWFFYRVLVQFVLTGIFVLILALLSSGRKSDDLRVATVFVFMFCLLVMFRNTDLLLSRYFFYRFGLTIFTLPYLVKNVRFVLPSVLAGLILVSPFQFVRMIENARWEYADQSYTIMFRSLPEFINAYPENVRETQK